MRYPKDLLENGTIGFTAPSFGCAIQPYKTGFENALKKFKEKGYNIFLGETCFLSEGTGISASPKKCARDLEDVYLGRSDVVISCGGGELMCETIEEVDFDKIREAPPKWFVGYSDNTNLTFLLNTICDTASIYAQCAPSFGMEPWDASLVQTFDLIRGVKRRVSGFKKWEALSLKSPENPLAVYNLTEDKKLVIYKGNECIKGSDDPASAAVNFSGRLLGGCLDILLNLCGTKYDKVAEFNKRYAKDGVIWFIESCDLTPLQIRRGLWELKAAGWFDCASGFIFGRPLCFDKEEMGVTGQNAPVSVLGDMNQYIILDADIGHLPPAIPVVSGAYANVSAADNIDMEYIYL